MDKELRVLILEDVPRDAELVEQTLRRAGIAFTAKLVDTRGAFLNELREFKPDIVLSDYTLPRFTGMEALELVKEQFPSIPVIIITGSIDEETAVQCMRAGAADYVIKDHLLRLGPAVQNAMEAKRERMDKDLAEEGMRAAARQWRATFDAIADAVSLLDAEGKIVRCNKAMIELMGRSWGEIIGCSCASLVRNTLGTIEGCPFARMVESRRRERAVLETNDRCLEITVDPLLDDANNLAGAVHVISDITERKRAEEALRQSEARYRALWEGAAEGILVADIETRRFTYANPAVCKMLGYTVEELERMGVADIHPKEDLEGVIAYFEQQARGERALALELPCLRKDGTKIYADINAVNILIDGRPYNVGFFTDVTLRRRADQTLRESEAKFRAVYNGSNDAIMLLTREGFFDCNPRTLEMFGFNSQEELIRVDPADISPPTQPDGRPSFGTVLEHIETAYRQGHHRFEWVFRRTDGKEFCAEMLLSAFGYGGKRALQATARDITERRQIENQLRAAQKMEAVGQLAGGVAHDFNNILTGIGGYTQLLLDKAEENSEIWCDLKEIRDLAERAANLTRQLLAFSRRQPIEPVVLNLNSLVENMLKMLKRLIGENIRLDFIPAPDLANVRVDPGQAEQVMMNLVVNARDAMPQGGRLAIETSNITLDQEYAGRHLGVTPGKYILLTVADTGSGMDEHVRERIFEPFFTTKPVGQGTGLGLSTVYGIIKQHNGDIWVYSEPNGGTTFKIYLPAVEAEADEVTRSAAEPPQPGRGEMILLVEDERAVRELAKRILTNTGYAVLAAASPTEARQAFDEHSDKVELLVTDVVLPECNGRQLYQELAARRSKLKVLYMSGYTADTVVGSGVLKKGVTLLTKPFTPNALAAKVREVLDADRAESAAGTTRPEPS